MLVLTSWTSNLLTLTSRDEKFTDIQIKVHLVGEIFHDLCDAIEVINRLFTVHLIPVLASTLIVDIFGLYSAFQSSPLHPYFFYNLVTFYFILKSFILRVLIAHFGSTTSREPAKLIHCIAKLVNKLPRTHSVRYILQDYMREFQVRNFKLRTFFLTINWNLLLGVKSLFEVKT